MANIQNDIRALFKELTTFSKFKDLTLSECDGTNPWDVHLVFAQHNAGFSLDPVQSGDLDVIMQLKDVLSPTSKKLFCPYPWDDLQRLRTSISHAINKTLSRIDACYILKCNGNIAGHFFLWKLGRTTDTGLAIPELGIAITDEFQGKGLGIIAMRFLQAIAVFQGSDAVELTTAQDNAAGWNMYQKVGFVSTGDIKNPLEVDVTEAINGNAQTNRYRVERQMVFIINASRKKKIMEYLKNKRILSKTLYE